MTLSTNLRKLNLIVHLTSSLGWFGGCLAFIFLGVFALNQGDFQVAGSLSYGLKICTWYVILPLCIISLFSGIIQAVGTQWGLFKHYWIIIKLLLTCMATILLIIHLQPIDMLSNAFIKDGVDRVTASQNIISLISKAGLAAITILLLTTISVFKPWGKRIKNNPKMKMKKKSTSFYILIGLVALILIVLLKHLIDFGGIPNH